MGHYPTEHCRVGLQTRCGATGCEWKKVFGNTCAEVKLSEFMSTVKLPSTTTTKPKPKKIGRVVKENVVGVKYKEVIRAEVKKSDHFFAQNIKTADQEDWLKKIKTA
jgi:hypothetical protein